MKTRTINCWEHPKQTEANLAKALNNGVRRNELYTSKREFRDRYRETAPAKFKVTITVEKVK